MSEIDPVAALQQRVDEELSHRGLLQRELAAKIKVKAPTLNKMLTGASMKTAAEVLRRLRQIEDALELGRGDLLRAMGFVEDEVGGRQAIQREPGLRPAGREAILVLFDHFVDHGRVSKHPGPVRKAASSGKTAKVKAEEAAAIEEAARKVSPPDGTPHEGPAK